MKKIRYFKCKNNHETERFIDDHIKEVECEECGSIAKRMLSAPRCFGNTTGRSPSANYKRQP